MTKKSVIGVLGLAINDQGQYLLTKRHEPKYPPFHLKWNVPGGGMEFGETPEETLVREFGEELSVKPQILISTPAVFSHLRTFSNQTVHVTLLCYLVNLGHQTIVLDKKENVDLRWVMLEEIENLNCLPGTYSMVHKVHELHIHNNHYPHYNTTYR